MNLEFHIARIISGIFRCRVQDCVLLLRNPTRYQRYVAEDIYNEAYGFAIANGVLTDEKIHSYMLDNDLWIPADEDLLKKCGTDIDYLKINIFNNYWKLNLKERGRSKKYIIDTKKLQSDLFERKHAYVYATAEGFANLEKNKYLIAVSLHDNKNKRVFKSEAYFEASASVIDSIMGLYRETRLSEDNIRELVRSERWRSFWCSRKAENSIFGKPVVDLNDEQKSLILWSNMYDNIAEHSESPGEDVMNDNDALDGWLLVQKDKRDKELAKRGHDDSITNEKIKNSQEIFVAPDEEEPVGSFVSRVENLNDDTGRIHKAARMRHLQKHGFVPEVMMPDSQLKMRKQFIDMNRK